MPKIILYRDKCIGCALCAEMQPDHWRMSKKDGKATLVKADIKKGVHTLEIPVYAVPFSREVAKGCPVRVIKVS